MLKKKPKENNHKKKILVWVISAAVALVLFIAAIAIEGYFSYKAQRDNFYEKVADTIIESNDKDEDPGKIKQFEISIPKIGVSAPVVPNVDGTNRTAYNEALKSGTAHFQGTALPNSGSNIFIFGHSSSILGTGTYDKIFAKLNNLVTGDEIDLIYNGKTYKYQVSNKKIVQADDTSVVGPTMNEQLTLMTCWPIGSDAKRLIVIALPVK